MDHTLAFAKPATDEMELVRRWMEEFDEDGLCAKTETGRCYMVVVKGCWVEFYVYYQTAVGVGINGGNAFCPWGLLMGN